EVCRLRDTPIMTFINKLDRDGRPPIELLDEIERVLRIPAAPPTWPIGMGRELRGIYHRSEDRIYVYAAGERGRVGENRTIEGLGSGAGRDFLGDQARSFDEEIALVKGASHGFDAHAYLAGRQTPVFFGSAINNFGVEELLAAFTRHAPGPLPRSARERSVAPGEAALAGFVFKIQANMDPAHRDRIAFLRLCAGKYARGMRLYHVRLGKEVRVADALTFMAAERAQAEEAYAGDIIGLHKPGTINTARWVESADARRMEEFRSRMHDHLALDHGGALVYLAPSRVNLELTLERWPDIAFRETREHAAT